MMEDLTKEKQIWELEHFALKIRRRTLEELHNLGAGHLFI